MRTIAPLLFAFVVSSCSTGAEMSGMSRIHYLPIGVETYVPITEMGIHEQFSRSADVHSGHRDLAALLALLRAAGVGHYDENRVRAHIVLADGVEIFIDNDGGVRVAEDRRRLNAEQLKHAAKLLEKLTTQRTAG